jgi:hypothetical protein
MPLIGEYEAAVKAADPNREPDQFKLNGELFTIAEDVNIIALGRFARVAREGATTDDMEGLAALIDTVGSLVVDEDETRFLGTCSRHRVQPELLLKIIQDVLEAQSGHPTERPSDSSDGSSATTVSSRVVSSYAASSTPTSRAADWRDTPFGRRELSLVPELYEDFGTVEQNASRVG